MYRKGQKMSKLREKSKFCALCGAMETYEHHLIFGTGVRKLADEDDLIIDLCINCHTKGPDRVHDNIQAERLSKMLGQMMYERDELAKMIDDSEGQKDKVRQQFLKRYGRSYL